ncbi:spore coat protein U domain-containing protein [Burkholderia cenocepacia]|uniref:spore coat protein U domain-containing protein n=1 Tax=Burkholderia cenocepacia TaxID=95486 RepID=UPI00158D7D93|nr:spore coat protein U domain-containing protein [Burkholderia cenocepacia]
MKINIAALAFISALVSYAQAEISIGSTKASAQLASSCQITATNIAFGEVSPTSVTDVGWSTTTSTTGTFKVLCTTGTTYSIALNMGSSNSRLLTSSTTSDSLQFTICQTNSFVPGSSPHCTKTWKTGSDVYSGSGTGKSTIIPMYAFLNKNFVTPASYSEIITATVSY